MERFEKQKSNAVTTEDTGDTEVTFYTFFKKTSSPLAGED